jgi:hypothetical protein
VYQAPQNNPKPGNHKGKGPAVENFSNILRSTTEISMGSRVNPRVIALDAALEQEEHFDQNIRKVRGHNRQIF